ncbi:unnamed protein product [Heligmosomoides polygyrus]|uniref:Glucuronosyltransferase n=1 Tax=Heligmosomoides polygyrus TaxID=6339 RepID=A0A183GFB3_HELPZ|nr:unnamed protein product [Heligmosomoides polygyrus]
MEALSMNTVDCVLISNWHSLIALPFYVENCGFRGVVYATEPVVQFGRLMMMELIEYFERIVFDEVGSSWKDPAVYSCLFPITPNPRSFPNALIRNPLEWKPFYTKQVMEQALARITTVAFNQAVVSTSFGNNAFYPITVLFL